MHKEDRVFDVFGIVDIVLDLFEGSGAMAKQALAGMMVVLFVVSGSAARADGVAESFTWNGGTADWDDTTAWTPTPDASDFGDTLDDFTATSGQVRAYISPVFDAKLTIQGNGDPDAYSGAMLNFIYKHTGITMTANDLHLDGGRFYYQRNSSCTVNGAMTIDPPTTGTHSWWDIRSDGKTMNFNASISGSGDLLVDNGGMQIKLSSANSTYSGDWTLTGSHALWNNAANAMGTGSVTINGSALTVNGDLTNLTGGVTVNSGGGIYGYASNNWGNVDMNGGLIEMTRSGNITVTGTLDVQAPSTVRGRKSDAGKVFTLNTVFTGSEKMILNNPSGYSRVRVQNGGSTSFTGGWDILQGKLELIHASGLGGGLGPGGVAAGPLYIDDSGLLDLGGSYGLHVFGLTLESQGAIAGSPEGTLYNVEALPSWSTYFSGSTANSTITVYEELGIIPEPAGLGLLGLALLGARRKRQ